MTKYTIENFLDDIEEYAKSFNKFELFSTENEISFPVKITQSVEVLVRKFGYWYEDSCEEEINDIKEVLTDHKEDINTYSEFLPIHEFLEDLDGHVSLKYSQLFDNSFYSLKSQFSFDNYKMLSGEQRKYLNLPKLVHSLDDMADVVYSLIKSYIWIRRFQKHAIIEKIMTILSNGYFPCGIQVLTDSENIFERDIRFLVFKKPN